MSQQVRVISSQGLRDAQGTPGLARYVADESDDHWFGRVVAAPETLSGWHHHGDNTTLGYVISGSVRVEFGPGGREGVDASAGDYFVVPPNTVHREGNATSREAEAIIARFGDGPPVFAADGPDGA